MKKTYQKPISQDVHFKYRCPSKQCTNEHWLSLKETQTKNFKVVCDCGKIFKPKRINKIKILYEKIPKPHTNSQPTKEETIKSSVDQNLLNKSINVMIGFGFTKEESAEMLTNYCLHHKYDDQDLSTLIKNTIAYHSNIGENNV